MAVEQRLHAVHHTGEAEEQMRLVRAVGRGLLLRLLSLGEVASQLWHGVRTSVVGGVIWLWSAR